MNLNIKRIDHLGVVAGVMKDINLIEKLDMRLQIDNGNQEVLTPGETISGMIINSLGFASKPMSLTPMFFDNKALEQLIRPGIMAEHFDRHRLGRALDKIFNYGCDTLFYEIASEVCKQENIDTTFTGLDTTTLSVTGEYFDPTADNMVILQANDINDYQNKCDEWLNHCEQDLLFIRNNSIWEARLRIGNGSEAKLLDGEEFAVFTIELDKAHNGSDYTTCALENVLKNNKLFDNYEYHRMHENIIKLEHGYSKDLRSDLKQVVHELIVSQDGGVPLMMQSWSGGSSDSTIFKQRSDALIKCFQESPSPRYLIADSKLYSENNAENLAKLQFITRIPGSIIEENKLIDEAINKNMWDKLDDNNCYYVSKISHYNIAQRWIVVNSSAAADRAKKSVAKAVHNEFTSITKQLIKLSKIIFNCKEDALLALSKLDKTKYHKIESPIIEEVNIYTKKGRPKKDAKPDQIKYSITATVNIIAAFIKIAEHQKSCFVIATNIPIEQLSAPEIVQKYKMQNSTLENVGFRFIKDKMFFADSLFLKNPHRIMALLTIMTLSLLIYSVAQRRMRAFIKSNNEILPKNIHEITFANKDGKIDIKNNLKAEVNASNKPSYAPTIRWLFQLLDGINVVTLIINNVKQIIFEGITPLKEKILSCFGTGVMQIYRLV